MRLLQSFHCVHQLFQFLIEVSRKLLLHGCVSTQDKELWRMNYCNHLSDPQKLGDLVQQELQLCAESSVSAQEVARLPKSTGQ